MTTGHIQIAQLNLMRATQEWLNIGILFTDTDTGDRHHRLLSNTSGFECLYTDAWSPHLRFALAQTREILEAGMQPPPGWNIRLTSKSWVSGDSAADILDEYYNDLIPIAHHEPRPNTKNPRTTGETQKTMRKHINRICLNAGQQSPWRDHPVRGTIGNDAVEVRLEMQTRNANISIRSIDYAGEKEREQQANGGIGAQLAAKTIFPDTPPVLHLLYPSHWKDQTTRGNIEMLITRITHEAAAFGGSVVTSQTHTAMAEQLTNAL